MIWQFQNMLGINLMKNSKHELSFVKLFILLSINDEITIYVNNCTA